MVVNGQQLPSISVPQAGSNASGDGSRGEGIQPSIREQGSRGGEQQHQQDACLQAVNPVKLKKSPGWEQQAKQQEPSTNYNSTNSAHYNSSANTNGHSNNNNGNNGSNRHQSKSRAPSGVFDSVPFTPSQGVTRTPSSSSGQFNFDPYWGWGLYGGRESPNMMLRGAPTDEQSGAFSSHMPFPPYLMAFSMAYPSNVEASSPQYAPPSPLMGSPVGTPTAMMFPQTPFAGTHGAHHAFSPYPGRHSGTFSLGSPTRNPPFPEPLTPNGMSPKGYGFFHPMFNNFPAFLVPPPRQRSSSGFTSPKKAPGGGYSGGNGHNKQQQQQQLHKQERSSGQSGESASTMEYGWDAGLSPWPPSSIGAPPMNDQGGGSMGPWGKFPPPFPPSPYGYGPSPRAPSCSGMPSYPMPMHLLPPMFAMHSSGTFNTVWPPSSSNCPPPGPPSPPPMGSSAKGRPSNGSTSTVATQPTNPYFLPASSLPPPPGAPTHSSMNTGGGGSSASSTCSSMFSMPTPAQSPPNNLGAGSIASAVGGSSGGSSGKDSKKGKPRPPPLQLNALPGSGLHSGPPGIVPIPGAGAAGGPPGPMFFPPPGQHGPDMPIPSPAPFPTWDDSHPPMPDHPFGTSPPSQLPPHQPPGRAPTPPGTHPYPFFALPGHFGLAAPTPFMPMPFLPHMLQGNGMPLMAHMMPPGFPPGMAVPPPPPGHPFGHPMGPPPPGGHPAASPYAHHPMHGPHLHLTPPNSSSKGRRPQQGPGQMAQHGTPGSAGGPGKVDTPPRLNARQRRTLRRAKERAIKGLMEAGHLALKNRQGGSPQQGMEGSPPSSKPKSREEELSGSDTEEAMKAASAVDNATASYYVSAAMSVVAGSHGPEAAANASEAISKVAADLDDVDLTNLISHLSQRKGEAGHQGGKPAAEEGLLRDLQIIQNLIGALRCSDAAGACTGASATGARDGKEREGARKEGDDRERWPIVQGAGKGGRTGLPGQQQQQQQQQHQGRQAGVRQFGQQQQQQQQGGHAGRAKPEGGQQPLMYHVRAMC